MLTAPVIAKVMGALPDVVSANWPLIQKSLAAEGIGTPILPFF